MNWIFYAFTVAAVIHVVEEYFFPGGFTDALKTINPKLARSVTTQAVVVINGLMIILCILGVIVGTRNLIFSLSVAGLFLINGIIHTAASIKTQKYVPGLISGILLYFPLALYAFYFFTASGKLDMIGCMASIILGILYNSVPFCYFTISTKIKRA